MDENLKQIINKLKSEIDSLRPLDKETEDRIQQKFRLDWNYHSNNIEGNSLTFGETKSFLLHGITADGKPLKDHLDIKGHNEVLLLLQDIIKDERPLTENFIREIHQTILHEPYNKEAITPEGKKTSRRITIGQYKTQPNHVKTQTGEMFYFAKPEETPAMMNDLMVWFNSGIDNRKLHPVELAALLHYKFIRIHPFDDGNGRLARILMNLTLIKFGFPPVIIKTQKKDEYYRALQQADGGETDFFVDYIAQLQIDSLELYLRGAKGENIEEDSDIDKEIALFKARLEDIKAEQIFTSDTLKDSMRWLENNLLNNINLKLKNLTELFEESIISIQPSNGQEYICFQYIKKQPVDTSKLHINKTKDFFYQNLNDKISACQIVISLMGFDKPGYSRFTIQTLIPINFEKYRFILTILTNQGNKKYSFLYDDLQKEQSSTIKEILNTLMSDLMEKIKNSTEKTY